MIDSLVYVLKDHALGIQPSGNVCRFGDWTEHRYGSLLWGPDEYEQHVAEVVRKHVAKEIVDEIDRCADVLVTDADESGNYLTAAVLQKASDIARVVGGLPKRGKS